MEIWKFTLQPLINHIDMPDHARVLSAAFQGDELRVWAVVVPSNRSRKRGFFVAGTGWPCDDKAVGAFVGTAFHPDGLVFHVFDHGYAPSPQEPVEGSDHG
jgi:hypothetical protein